MPVSDIGTISPRAFGAVGDGVTDDTAALIEAASHGTIVLNEGYIYLLTDTADLGQILNLGGFIKIASTKTLTGVVIGDASVPCFSGEGRFFASNNVYSVAWFDGATLDVMWDFCRRGFIENERKTVIWPAPLPGVEAAYESSPGVYAPGVWKVAAPIQMDGDENNSIHLRYSLFFGVTRGMSAMIEYSSSAKTEDISWPFGVDLDCGSNADYGILSHGGARMYHGGKNRIMRPRLDGVRLTNNVNVNIADTAEPEFEFLEVTKFGRNAVSLAGTVANTILSAKFGKIFSNGARGVWGKAVVNGSGVLTGIDLDGGQDLTGHFVGEVLRVVAKSGTATGATFTLVEGNFNIHGQLQSLPAPGGTLTGYSTAQEVYLTAADCYVKISGNSRECRFDDIYEVQVDSSKLCKPADALVIVEATSDGASLALELGSIRSRTGNRPALISRTTNSGNAKHSLMLNDFSVTGAVYNSGAYVQLAHVSGGSVTCSMEPSANLLVAIDASVSNFDLNGISLSNISGEGFGPRVRIGGRFASRVTLTDDQIVQIALPVGAMGTVDVITTDAGWLSAIARGGLDLQEIAKASAAAIHTGALSIGNSTDNAVNASLSTNTLYVMNRTGASRQFVVYANV